MLQGKRGVHTALPPAVSGGARLLAQSKACGGGRKGFAAAAISPINARSPYQ
jgi:hypothetical protein